MSPTNWFQCMPNPNFHNPTESILDIVLYNKIIQIWLILSIKKKFHQEFFFHMYSKL
jgi:hypothetical protein